MDKNHQDVVIRAEESIRQLQLQRADASGQARVKLTGQINMEKGNLRALKKELGITSSKKHSGFA